MTIFSVRSTVLVACLLVALAVPLSAQTSLTIPEIQGAGHFSPFIGANVQTTGIVTALASNGFYMQDPRGDGNLDTSDGILVFTGSSPSVAVGDQLSVTGDVLEFQPGSAGLTITEIVSQSIGVLSSGNPLPVTILGPGGRVQPTEVIEDDAFGDYQPASDGIDFYESLEGMYVSIPSATAVSNTNQFGEYYVVPGEGSNIVATGMNSRGGITISPGDFNPERIQIDDTLLGSSSPNVHVGEPVRSIQGVIGYNFSAYELNVTQNVSTPRFSPVVETSTLTAGPNRVTVASYNVLNLDPTDPQGKFDSIASQIVNNLNSPDIIGLQEIQDSDGPGIDDRLDADVTFSQLIQSITSSGGPTYAYAEVPPESANIDGGQPTGNIRVGYLYNPSRVSLVANSLIRHGENEPAFFNSRKPLEATFEFNGELITLINNHFRSKGGSDPLYGIRQPPLNGGEFTRVAQAQFVAGLVEQILAGDPNANVVVLGDLNEFQFLPALEELTGGSDPLLHNLYDLLAEEEQYSFIFEGNSQALDHILATESLLSGAQFDAVHTNSGIGDIGLSYTISDHDPLLASFVIGIPEPSTVVLAILAMCLPWGRRSVLGASTGELP